MIIAPQTKKNKGVREETSRIYVLYENDISPGHVGPFLDSTGIYARPFGAGWGVALIEEMHPSKKSPLVRLGKIFVSHLRSILESVVRGAGAESSADLQAQQPRKAQKRRPNAKKSGVWVPSTGAALWISQSAAVKRNAGQN